MTVNGKEIKLKETITITELLDELNLSKNKVVIEVNYNIISKEKYDTYVLENTDKVEIVSFVGGG